jgi:transcriptional regulator with XRE-family HTH domain
MIIMLSLICKPFLAPSGPARTGRTTGSAILAAVARTLSQPRPKLAERLVALRRAAGLTQHELAEALGVAQSTVAQWERSQTPPRSDVLPQMGRIFGVSVEEILNVEGRLPAAGRGRRPTGKVWKLFEEVSTLPRRQQEKVIEFVSAFVKESRRAARRERRQA